MLIWHSKNMESHSVEKIETQNQIPQIMEPSKGTSFFRTCFNGINALSGKHLIICCCFQDTSKSRSKS